MNVEVIAVFREERQGVEGLEKMKKSSKTNFTMALDTGKKQTAIYSPGRLVFDNYVIDSNGKIAAIIPGDLRKRAKSEELLKVLKGLKKKGKGSKKK